MNNLKRGQSNANGAAITLIVVTVIVVLYILFLPPAEREALLGDNVSRPGEPSSTRPVVLLQETVGRLDYIPDNEVNFDLASFNLRTFTSAQVVASKSNLYVKNSVFDKLIDTFEFRADENTKDLMLTFNAVGRGRLEVILNDKRVFFGEVDGNSPPIYIDNRDLSSSNKLEFSVTSPGIAFWRYNYFDITDLRIVGDVTDVSRSSNTQSFSLTTRDIDLLSTSRLRYLASCNPNTVKNFEIRLNNDPIFSGIPDCQIFNYISIGKDELFPGVNFLEFRLDEGEVTIDQLRLSNRLQLPDNPLYYFEVDEKYFYDNDTLRREREANLTMRFPNNDRKRLELFINGRVIGVNVLDSNFERTISGYLLPGTNTIEIRPLQTVDIVEMRISLR